MYSLTANKPATDTPELQGILAGIRGWKSDWKKFLTAQETDVPVEKLKEIKEQEYKSIVVSGVKKDIVKNVEVEYDPVVCEHMYKKPDIDISDIKYFIKSEASNKDNAVNLDTFTEMWHFSDFVTGYLPSAGKVRLLKYYGASHNREFNDLLEVPEIITCRNQLNGAGCFTYGKNHTYAWTVNSRYAILETLRHIHFLKKNGIVYYDDFDGRHWFIKEQFSCEYEIVKALRDKYDCTDLREYNNGIKVMVTRHQTH